MLDFENLEVSYRKGLNNIDRVYIGYLYVGNLSYSPTLGTYWFYPAPGESLCSPGSVELLTSNGEDYKTVLKNYLIKELKHFLEFAGVLN